MHEQEFILPFPPSVNEHLASFVFRNKKGRYQARQIATKKWRDYLQTAAWELIKQNRNNFKGEVSVEIQVYPPDKRRRDLDNIVKAVFDSLTQSGTVEDDFYINKHSVERKKELLNQVKIKVIKED
jgi:crossover junction endodeoxyribonuclease RusA